MVEIPVLHMIGEGLHITNANAPRRALVMSNPCVKIGFFFDPKVSARETMAVTYDTVFALVDTGADHVYVDHSMIEKFNCPVAVGGEAMTVNNETGSTAHRASLFIIENAHVLDLYVIGRDFQREARPFQMVLGRRFLQFCDLRWNGPEHDIRIDYKGTYPGAF